MEAGVQFKQASLQYAQVSELIDEIAKEESQTEEIAGKTVSEIFDGTTLVVEALNIVLRLIADWKVEQRLAHLLLIALVTKCTRHFLKSSLRLGSACLYAVLFQDMLLKQKQGSLLCVIQRAGGGPSLKSLIKCMRPLLERVYQRQQHGTL